MDMDKTRKLLDDVLSDEPSQTTLDIYKFIKEHRIRTHYKYGNFIKQFEDLFGELNIIVSMLNYVPKDSWHDNKSLQYILYPEMMRTLHRAFEDTIDGYYDEALMLHRSVYETFLRIVFLSYYLDARDAIFVSIKGKVQFNATNFPQDQLGVKWGWLYKILSAVYHSKKHKTIPARTGTKKQRKAIILEYKSDDTAIGMPINFTTFNLACMFHAVVSIFSSDFPMYAELKKRTPRINKVDKSLLGIIECNPRKEFRQLASDIRKIGKIIQSKDKKRDRQRPIISVANHTK